MSAVVKLLETLVSFITRHLESIRRVRVQRFQGMTTPVPIDETSSMVQCMMVYKLLAIVIVPPMMMNFVVHQFEECCCCKSC